MTTYEYATTRARGVLSVLAEWVRPRARALTHAWRRLRPLSLPIAGVGCFVAAAFTVSVLAGLITAGLACFFVEWRAAK